MMRRTLITSCWLLVFVSTPLVAQDVQIDKLINDLNNPDGKVCVAALDALEKKGPDVAVPALIQVLGAESARVRAYAAYGLRRIGKPATPAADALMEAVFDENAMVRRESIRALLRIDPPVEKTRPLVIRILKEGDTSSILPALQSVAAEGKAAVPRVTELLNDALAEDELREARYWACVVLADIGPEAAAAVPVLTKALQDGDPDVRHQALIALGEIGPAAKSAAAEIVALGENDAFEDVRYAAIFALGKIGKTESGSEILSKAVKSDDAFLRTIAAWALAMTHPENQKMLDGVVKMLIDAFDSEDVHVRRAAARALVELEVDRESVAPVLVQALQDQDPKVVGSAIEALSGLGSKVLKHIDDALQNKELRHFAVLLISRLGPEAASVVPDLIAVLEKQTDSPDDVEFVREAHFALSRIGPAAKEAIPTLIDALDSKNDEVSASASYALGKMGPAAIAAIPALTRAEKREDLIVKAASTFALWRIQPDNALRRVKAAKLLVQALDEDRELVRAGAATMLGELEKLSRPVKTKLEKVRDNDESELVRKAAAEALKKLRS